MTVSYKYLEEVPSKLETQYKKFCLVLHPSWYFPLNKRGGVIFFAEQTKSIKRDTIYLQTVP